jgi:ABC-type dipeptide/oligopeptide/nickel transport system ATPase component
MQWRDLNRPTPDPSRGVRVASLTLSPTIVRHEGVSYRAANRRALELLDMVQIPSAARHLKAYPHEISGGMRQRAMIALACRPSVLMADEPNTALDVTVQIQIILLLRQLQQELGMAVIFVTHDVGVAVEVADRIAVMYAGRFVEVGAHRAGNRCASTSLYGGAAHLHRVGLGRLDRRNHQGNHQRSRSAARKPNRKRTSTSITCKRSKICAANLILWTSPRQQNRCTNDPDRSQ